MKKARLFLLKPWMVLCTCSRGASEVQAILGARSPLELARSICVIGACEATLECTPFWRLSRSSSLYSCT